MTFFIRGNQLDTNPHQQQCTHQLERRQRQQCHGKGNQDDAQDDGTGGAVDDALATLLRRQLAAGQRNHHSVVAAQQDVDDDDLPQSNPEWGMGEKVEIHVKPRLKTADALRRLQQILYACSPGRSLGR